MAQKSTPFGFQCHARSTSLPSRTQPDYCKIEIELNKLKTWESSSSLSISSGLTSDAIQTGIVGLAELYNCVQDLLESSSTTQQTLLKHRQHETIVEETLEGSVQFLDFCSTVKELRSAMREHLQDLQSALRRKGGDHSSIESNINAYISLRKKVKKYVIKSLKTLKKMENNVESSPIFDEDQQLAVLIRLLREVAATTISVFRSLLLFLSMPDSKLKFNGWSLISKLMAAKSSACGRDQKVVNEVGCVDVILQSLHEHTHTHSSNSKVEVRMILKRLQSLDSNIQGLEAGLDCLYRVLIQNRVSLLNIITS